MNENLWKLLEMAKADPALLAALEATRKAVSYTHLDVYKRQDQRGEEHGGREAESESESPQQ